MSTAKKIGFILLPLIADFIPRLVLGLDLYGLLSGQVSDRLYMMIYPFIVLLSSLVFPIIIMTVFKEVRYTKMISYLIIFKALGRFLINFLHYDYYFSINHNFRIVNLAVIAVLSLSEIIVLVYMILLYKSLNNDFMRKGALVVIIIAVILNLSALLVYIPSVYWFLFENIAGRSILRIFDVTLQPFIVFLGLKEIGEF